MPTFTYATRMLLQKFLAIAWTRAREAIGDQKMHSSRRTPARNQQLISSAFTDIVNLGHSRL